MERRAGRFGNILSRDGKVDVNSRPLSDRPPMNWAPVTVIIFLLKLRRARLGTRPDGHCSRLEGLRPIRSDQYDLF